MWCQYLILTHFHRVAVALDHPDWSWYYFCFKFSALVPSKKKKCFMFSFHVPTSDQLQNCSVLMKRLLPYGDNSDALITRNTANCLDLTPWWWTQSSLKFKSDPVYADLFKHATNKMKYVYFEMCLLWCSTTSSSRVKCLTFLWCVYRCRRSPENCYCDHKDWTAHPKSQ